MPTKRNRRCQDISIAWRTFVRVRYIIRRVGAKKRATSSFTQSGKRTDVQDPITSLISLALLSNRTWVRREKERHCEKKMHELLLFAVDNRWRTLTRRRKWRIRTHKSCENKRRRRKEKKELPLCLLATKRFPLSAPNSEFPLFSLSLSDSFLNRSAT